MTLPRLLTAMALAAACGLAACGGATDPNAKDCHPGCDGGQLCCPFSGQVCKRDAGCSPVSGFLCADAPAGDSCPSLMGR